jgi:hypothetical protein
VPALTTSPSFFFSSLMSWASSQAFRPVIFACIIWLP